ncbi:uncharacterized protein IWZ02DRAFT_39984 [Phyllosticta citriasiana]|uniref:Uncharacterized protein n=1 Tax=Phyllosticta citriasiana TaxID=595635 RepID=A0ABR1KBT0_9PEZI
MDCDFPLYALELSRLRDFSDQRRSQRKIHFRLESDSIPIRSSPLDLWVPTFQKYGPSPEGNVRHLDETSTWRGLSMAQAREIKFWEDMFAAVLEYKISNHLIDIIDAMDERGAARRPESLNHRICESINNMGCRNYPVNIREFLTCMIELHKRNGSHHQWLASSGDFYNGLCEFLRTRDCFLDTPLLPTVKVAFSATMNAQGEPTICGRVKRYGPIVRFTWLDTEASLSRKCHIHPVFVDSVLDPEYDAYVGCPEYQLKSDCVAFEWDASQKGFVGYLKSGHIKPSKMPTPTSLDLMVTGTRLFPENVRFERIIRLKIDIVVHEELSKVKNYPLTWSPSYESFGMSSYERLSSELRQDARRRYRSPAIPVDDLSLLMKTRKRGRELGHRQNLSPGLAKWQQGLEPEHGRAQSEPSSTRASTGNSSDYHNPFRSGPVPDIPAWWKLSTDRSTDAPTSLAKNVTPTSLISLADCAESGAQPDPCPSIWSPSQLFNDPATIRGGAHGPMNQHESTIIPSAPDGSGTLSQRRQIMPTVDDFGSLFQSGSTIKHELDRPYWPELYKRRKSSYEGPSSRRAVQKTSSESGAFKVWASDNARHLGSSHGSSNETIRFPVSSTPPRQSDTDAKGLHKRSKSCGPFSAQTSPTSIYAPWQAEQISSSTIAHVLLPEMLDAYSATEQSSSIGKDKTGDQEQASSRRDDSVFSEASRVTALQSNCGKPEDFQAEIKEWYDILFLKQQVERDLGKSRAGNKSDEEAFEEAFRGEADAETEAGDHETE